MIAHSMTITLWALCLADVIGLLILALCVFELHEILSGWGR